MALQMINDYGVMHIRHAMDMTMDVWDFRYHLYGVGTINGDDCMLHIITIYTMQVPHEFDRKGFSITLLHAECSQYIKMK